MAEAHNNSAVALANLKKFEESKKELIQAIRTNSSLPEAHENLVRLTINEESQRQDFWEFWGASPRRRRIVTLLSILAASVVVFGIVSPYIEIDDNNVPNEGIINSTKNTTTINGSQKKVTTLETYIQNKSNSSADTSLEVRIPESYLVVVALIVLIILAPQLKSLKAGPVEVELQTRESVEIDSVLTPTQDEFISEGGYLYPKVEGEKTLLFVAPMQLK